MNQITDIRLDDPKSGKQIITNVISIAFPAFLNTAFKSAFTIVDAIMVGQLGAFAIAAVGLVKQPVLLLFLAIEGLSIATTALIAQKKGVGDQEGANEILRESLLIAFCFALLLALIGLVLAHPIVSFMGARSDTLQPSVIYFRCVMFGFLFDAIASNIGGALTGAGNTKIILYANLVSNFVNIGFNYLLIGGKLGFPAWGIMGAGIATALSKLAVFIVMLIVLFNRHQYVFLTVHDRFCITRKTLSAFLHIGAPVLGQRAATRFGMLIMVRMVSPLGTAVMASYQMCFNIHNMAFWCAEAIGRASTSLAGQSIGAKKPDLALRYIRTSVLIGVGFSLLTGLIILLNPYLLLRMFTPDTIAITIGIPALFVIAIFQPFQAASNVIAGGLTGLGNTRIAAVTIALGIAVLRPLVAFGLTESLSLGLVGIWIAIGADEIFRFICVLWGITKSKAVKRLLHNAQSISVRD